MKFEQLKKSLETCFYPIYLIEGEDAFFRLTSLKLIKEKYLQVEDLNFISFDWNEIKNNVEEFVISLNSFPFLSEKRIVLLNDFYPLAKDLKNKLLLEYFNNPLDSTILVILNSKLDKNIKKFNNVTPIDCSYGSESLLTKYISSNAKKNGLEIERLACEKIIEYALLDMTKIVSDINILISFCMDRKIITVNDVELLLAKETNFAIYEMVNYIVKKQHKSVYNTINDLVMKKNDEAKLFISIYFHFRQLLFISATSFSDKRLSELLGVREYAIKMNRIQARQFTLEKLNLYIDKFAFYDEGYKSGLISAKDSLWNMVSTLLI